MKSNPFVYSNTVPMRRDAGEALEKARAVLLAAGFRAGASERGGVVFLGPGLNSTRQNPLLGASRLRLVARGERLSVDADLGGARRLGRFARFFPPLLCLALAIVFTVVFTFKFDTLAWMAPVYGTTGLLAAVWLLVGPVLARAIRRNTWTALDELVAAVAQ